MINIQEKLRQGKSGGYERWTKIYNIKQISQALLFLEDQEIRDYVTLAERASALSTDFSKTSKKIKELENRCVKFPC